ncbi:MAG TPA: alpha/beta fold hydrolase [Solirubrobacteraceae bacterium]
MLIDVGDTRLHVTERGAGELALFVLHGGPGLDHTMFGSYLDALGDRVRLLLVDERGTGRSEPAAPETWDLTHHAADLEAMAGTLGLSRYAVLGHSYGAFIALQHAVEFPGRPAATIVSSGIPDARFLAHVEQELAAFEPVELREQVRASWAGEAHARTQEDVAALLSDQLPFHFADPRDPRIDDLRAALGDAVYGPDVLRAAATDDYGAIAVEGRLGEVAHPVLVLAGRQDRTCSVAAAEAMAEGLPDAELVVFEHSGHMAFIEENDAYLAAVRDFLERRAAG